MKIIIVKNTRYDRLNRQYKASLESEPGWWALGCTPNEAIAELVRTAQSVLDIQLIDPIS